MRSLPVIIVAILVGIIGTILFLGFIGEMNFGERDRGLLVEPGPGEILVPVSTQPIPAYSRVTRDHLLDPQTLNFILLPLNEENAKRAPIRDVAEILGRVVAEDKPRLTYFSEEDFLPEGTAPGIAGAIPPGKRAVVVESEKITGVHGLRQGDRFDLLANIGADQLAAINRAADSMLVGPGDTPTRRIRSGGTRVVVNNGFVVSGVSERVETYTGQGGLLGQREEKTRRVQEITLAVEPEEVPALTAAIANDVSMIAVVRSGRPEALETDVDIVIEDSSVRMLTPDEPEVEEGPSGIAIEEIRGADRRTTLLPGS